MSDFAMFNYLENHDADLEPLACPECEGEGNVVEWLTDRAYRLIDCEACDGDGVVEP